MDSSISKFYQKNRSERIQLLVERGFLTQEASRQLLDNPLLSDAIADSMIENQIGQFPLPLGVALNF